MVICVDQDPGSHRSTNSGLGIRNGGVQSLREITPLQIAAEVGIAILTRELLFAYLAVAKKKVNAKNDKKEFRLEQDSNFTSVSYGS